MQVQYSDAHPVTLPMQRLTDKVFDRRSHTTGLQAIDVRRSHSARKMRVLGERFKRAPTEWIALDVARRREEYNRGLDLGLFSEELASLVDHIGVERRG